jgi:hypothetical protein
MIGEIEIEPLGFGRPVLREADLDAEAGDPAKAGMAFRKISGLGAGQFAIAEARGAEDRHVIDREAGASAHGPEPWIGELSRRKRVFGDGQVDVGFTAINKISVLPVEAGF